MLNDDTKVTLEEFVRRFIYPNSVILVCKELKTKYTYDQDVTYNTYPVVFKGMEWQIGKIPEPDYFKIHPDIELCPEEYRQSNVKKIIKSDTPFYDIRIVIEG